MNTKELLKSLEKKSSFWLAWAMLWRMWVLSLGFYFVMILLILIIA